MGIYPNGQLFPNLVLFCFLKCLGLVLFQQNVEFSSVGNLKVKGALAGLAVKGIVAGDVRVVVGVGDAVVEVVEVIKIISSTVEVVELLKWSELELGKLFVNPSIVANDNEINNKERKNI